MGIDQQIGEHARFIDALVAAVGQDLFQRCLEANARAQEVKLVQLSEQGWQARVAEGEAHQVKVVTATSYLFGNWDGAAPMCTPFESMLPEYRAALEGTRVGVKVKIGKQTLVLTKVFVEGPEPGDPKPPAKPGKGKARRLKRQLELEGTRTGRKAV